jgi:hypothetical protein
MVNTSKLAPPPLKSNDPNSHEWKRYQSDLYDAVLNNSGVPGKDGKDGIDGKDGQNGAIGAFHADATRLEATTAALQTLIREKSDGFENDFLKRMLHKLSGGSVLHFTPDEYTDKINATDATALIESALSGTPATLAMFGADGHSVVDSSISEVATPGLNAINIVLSSVNAGVNALGLSTNCDGLLAAFQRQASNEGYLNLYKSNAVKLTLKADDVSLFSKTIAIATLTDGYIPFHSSDSLGLVNSILAQTALANNSTIDAFISQTVASTLPMLRFMHATETHSSLSSILESTSAWGGLLFNNFQTGGPKGGVTLIGIGLTQGLTLKAVNDYSTDVANIEFMRFISHKSNGSGGIAAVSADEVSHIFYNNTTPLLTILGNGATGFNCTAPTYQIEVQSSGAERNSLGLFDNRVAASGRGARMSLGGHATSSTSDPVVVFAQLAGLKENVTNADLLGKLLLLTSDAGGNMVQRLTIKSTGIINLANCPGYASQTAAVCAGLVAGDVYRDLCPTGDIYRMNIVV